MDEAGIKVMKTTARWDLVLIRHGMTPANEKRQYCGRTDLPLSPAGREKLREIRRSGLYSRWESCCECLRVTSGMRRTDETLQILFGKENQVILRIPDLREMDFGRFEGFTYEQLRDDEKYLKWISGDNERNVCPGGESGEQMRRRVLRAFDRQIRARFSSASADPVRPAAACTVVTHGGPAAAIMQYLFPGCGRNRYEWQPAPGEGWLVQMEGNSPLSFESLTEPR